MQLIKRVAADGIFLFHCIVVLMVGLGWLAPRIWPLYICTLLVTLISEAMLGHCFLSEMIL